MINKTIAEYLATHKRLVIPQFGAFIHKEPQGDVVFVPFLKKDDGVFIELLCGQYNIDAADAQAMITEYVTQVRAGVETQGRFEIEGLGSIRTDSNGIYWLERGTLGESGAPTPVATPGATPAPATIPTAPVTPAAPVTPVVPAAPAAPVAAAILAAPVATVSAPRPAVNPIPRPTAPPSQPVATVQPTSIPRPSTPNAPYSHSPRAQAPTRGRVRPQAAPQKTDRFMLIAILAATIALAAIVYGVVWGGNGPDINLIEMPAAHQAADSLQTTDSTTPASQQ